MYLSVLTILHREKGIVNIAGENDKIELEINNLTLIGTLQKHNFSVDDVLAYTFTTLKKVPRHIVSGKHAFMLVVQTNDNKLIQIPILCDQCDLSKDDLRKRTASILQAKGIDPKELKLIVSQKIEPDHVELICE